MTRKYLEGLNEKFLQLTFENCGAMFGENKTLTLSSLSEIPKGKKISKDTQSFHLVLYFARCASLG